MRHIKTMSGDYAGKSCLLIGGGHSADVKNFPYSKLPDYFYKICVNDAIPNGIRIDCLIHNDQSSKIVIQKKKLKMHVQTIISHTNAKSMDFTSYFYRDCDVLPAKDCDNTGVKAIILLRNILKFEYIYLIGFDFYTVDGVSHFNGDEVGVEQKYTTKSNLEAHIRLLDSMPSQFEKIQDYTKVYNCNRVSRLRVFPFGLPWEEN